MGASYRENHMNDDADQVEVDATDDGPPKKRRWPDWDKEREEADQLWFFTTASMFGATWPLLEGLFRWLFRKPKPKPK